jgi:hypothetical protein
MFAISAGVLPFFLATIAETARVVIGEYLKEKD